MRRTGVWTLLLPILWLGASSIARADDELMAGLVDENTYDLKADDETIGGPGLAFLLAATRDAQFFCFAEPHNVKQVPPIFTQLFEALQAEHGFHYAALESGPLILEDLGREPVRDNRDAINRLFGEYPRSFHFYTDEELQMMADLGRLSTAKAVPLWGVDQMHGTLAVLDALKRETNDQQIQEKINSLMNEVREFNKTRGRGLTFLKQDNDAFDRLRAWLQPPSGSRAEFLVDQLNISREIYRNYLRSEQGEPTGYTSNHQREENMKSLLVRYYRLAQASGDTLPKVMLKAGHWHLMKGLSPGRCYTLGNFVMDLAKSNDMTSFHLMVSVVNKGKNASSITNYPNYAPVTRAGSVDRWTIVDVRPLRPHVHSGALAHLHEDLKHWIFAYDAVLMIGGTKGGSYVTDVKRRFGQL